jgi:hypothetical protein
MTEIGEISVRKRRSRQEIKRLVAEFETSGLRRSEFCQKHNLALGTLQRGLRRCRMEVEGQGEGKRLVEVKVAGTSATAADREPALWKWCWPKVVGLKSGEILMPRL